MNTEDEKEKEKPKKCSFCGSKDHTINYCNIFLAIISAG